MSTHWVSGIVESFLQRQPGLQVGIRPREVKALVQHHTAKNLEVSCSLGLGAALGLEEGSRSERG